VRGQTPLHYATHKGDDVGVARLLLKRSALLDARDTLGRTPLHEAATMDKLDIAKLLMRRGADKLAKDDEGNTPLHLAVRWGKYCCAKALIERGALLESTNNQGQSVLYVAAAHGKVESVRLLLECGADPYGDVLHIAEENNFPAVVALLMERRSEKSTTPRSLSSCPKTSNDENKLPTIGEAVMAEAAY